MIAVSIEGSGPIAMALALFLRRQGLGPGSIGLKLPDPALPSGPASRAIALSDGSWQLLARIITPPAHAVIAEVDIGVLGHGLHSRLIPADIGLDALGRVVRHGDLWQALHQACTRDGLGRGGAVDARTPTLSVVADGRIAESAAQIREFDQAAITAELTISADSSAGAALAPRAGVAYERFKPDGPLAILPLPGTRRWSLVWCESRSRCAELMSASGREFDEQLAQRLGPRFGRFELAGTREVVNLRRVSLAPAAHAQEIAIGNAAQSLHPVAGQGMNLGLRDAFEAASAIGDALANDLPVASVVKSYIFRRRTDRQRTIGLTDWLAGLSERPHFSGLNNGATQSIAIGLLDSLSPLRRAAARRFVFGNRRTD